MTDKRDRDIMPPDEGWDAVVPPAHDLPEPQARAIAALVGGESLVVAAEVAGVNRSTLHRWHRDPNFVAMLDRARRDHHAAVQAELRALASAAICTLREVMNTPGSGPNLRVKIAMDILKASGVDRPVPGGEAGPPHGERKGGGAVNGSP